MTDFVRSLEAVQPYLLHHHHYDCKTIAGDVTLREFTAGALSYYPAWIRLLYWVRGSLVRLLGMHQEKPPTAPHLRPEEVSFQPGAAATFFTVAAAEEDQFWIASASDTHLSAYLIVAVEVLAGAHKRFHCATIVKYNNWAGPVYFNLIRPFHHLVVRAMMHAGVAYHDSPDSEKGLNDA